MSGARFLPMSIKIVGIGNGGVKIAERLNEKKWTAVEFLAAHADAKALAACRVQKKIHLADKKTMKQAEDELRQALAGADTIFVIADEDDDTAITPMIGKIAQEMNVLTTGIVTRPSLLEEQMAKRQGFVREEEGLRLLREGVDALLIVPDDTSIPSLLSALGA